MRGLARSDPDAPAAALLASVARQRWEKQLPDMARSPIFVRRDAFVLPGMFVMGATVENLLAGKALSTAREVLRSLASTPVTAAELDQARSEVVSAINKDRAKPDGIAEAWLEIEGYKLPLIDEQMRALNAVSSEDLRRVAGRLVDERGIASVVVGNSELIKTQLEKIGKVEVMGEMPAVATTPATKPTPNAAKPQSNSPSKPE